MAITGKHYEEALPLKDIMKAIPNEFNEESPLKEPLSDLFARIGQRQVPVRTFTRMWTLGSMQAKIAIGYLAYALRSNFANDNEKQRLRNEANLKAAIELFGTMGYLRGAIMKIGQMLGNLPHLLPDEIAETLDSLHFEAPPMHYSLIREVFLDELGEDPMTIFAQFEEKAFAAASLGQVHRAVLKTGEVVAVKIQYPNMAATIRADLGTLQALLAPMKLHTEWNYFLDHLQDAEQMLLRETDYRLEASFLESTRQLFNETDQIVVPRLWPQYSTDRVLTMDYLPGLHLKNLLATDPDQQTRNHFGELISRAFVRVYFKTKTLYADINPGNFIFMPDGRLGMIDFGCFRTFTDEEWQLHLGAEEATLTQNVESIDLFLARICHFDDPRDMEQERLDLFRKIMFWGAEPVLGDQPFAFGNRDFYQQGIDTLAEAARKRIYRYDSLYNWWDRMILSHRTFLYRLRSQVDYRTIHETEKTY